MEFRRMLLVIGYGCFFLKIIHAKIEKKSLNLCFILMDVIHQFLDKGIYTFFLL